MGTICMKPFRINIILLHFSFLSNINSFFCKVRDYLVCLILFGGGKRHHALTIHVTKILLGAHVDDKYVRISLYLEQQFQLCRPSYVSPLSRLISIRTQIAVSSATASPRSHLCEHILGLECGVLHSGVHQWPRHGSDHLTDSSLHLRNTGQYPVRNLLLSDDSRIHRISRKERWLDHNAIGQLRNNTLSNGCVIQACHSTDWRASASWKGRRVKRREGMALHTSLLVSEEMRWRGFGPFPLDMILR